MIGHCCSRWGSGGGGGRGATFEIERDNDASSGRRAGGVSYCSEVVALSLPTRKHWCSRRTGTFLKTPKVTMSALARHQANGSQNAWAPYFEVCDAPTSPFEVVVSAKGSGSMGRECAHVFAGRIAAPPRAEQQYEKSAVDILVALYKMRIFSKPWEVATMWCGGWAEE